MALSSARSIAFDRGWMAAPASPLAIPATITPNSTASTSADLDSNAISGAIPAGDTLLGSAAWGRTTNPCTIGTRVGTWVGTPAFTSVVAQNYAPDTNIIGLSIGRYILPAEVTGPVANQPWTAQQAYVPVHGLLRILGGATVAQSKIGTVAGSTGIAVALDATPAADSLVTVHVARRNNNAITGPAGYTTLFDTSPEAAIRHAVYARIGGSGSVSLSWASNSQPGICAVIEWTRP